MAASSTAIARRDFRSPVFGFRRRRRFTRTTSSAFISRCDRRPSHLPSRARLRSRSSLELGHQVRLLELRDGAQHLGPLADPPPASIGIDPFTRAVFHIGRSPGMATLIFIEPVKRPDGRDWYTDRGLLLRTRLGGQILCDKVHNAICETCQLLMSRGIVGTFETWKAGIPSPCMTGDIARTAELTVHEPDDGVVHFARWTPFDQNARSRSAVPSPAREDDGAGRG
jgi:hypothetical protein